MSFSNDTICAISTSLTPQGIGIIRISGDDAFNIAKKIFVNKNKIPIDLKESHKVYYGYIYDKKNDIFFDEVIVLTMNKPHSYTAEDVIEIQSHGNAVVLKKILNLILENGATLAEPGEFTKRAFLNGRIDLSEAEAVIDIINSKNDYARTAAINNIKGKTKTEIENYRKDILESLAFIEAALDDPEHISLDEFLPTLKTKIEKLLSNINKTLNNSKNGKILTEGINTVILGKPNVGKSSLLNNLTGEDSAIVTDIAGTTRDIIKVSVNFYDFTLNIIDTAGIRENEDLDKVEKIGIERAKKEAENADFILLLIDASTKLTNEDLCLFDFVKNKKFLLLLNKIDLIENPDNNLALTFLSQNKIDIDKNFVIPFSNKKEESIELLKQKIKFLFDNNSIDFNTEVIITNERQIDLLNKAKQSLSNVISSIDNEMPEDLLTIDLKDCYEILSSIIGEEVGDDLVNEIFSKFCMGK